MAATKRFDVIVIGGGPGGYVAAIRAAQNGATVALIEAGDLGGTCLNVGCIPTKALIAGAEVYHKIKRADEYGISVGQVSFDFAKMTKRKDDVVGGIRSSLEGLIRSNQIEIFRGYGRFTAADEVKVLGHDNVILKGEKVIIATGSQPRNMGAFPFDGERVHSSTTILDLAQLPKKLAVIGGGWIGCEAASLYRALGVEVTILEMMPRIIPSEGQEMAGALSRTFTTQGIEILTEVMVEGIDRTSNGVVVRLKDQKPVEAEMALVAIGRKLNTDDVGLDRAGVALTSQGAIEVNDRMETSVPNIYAIGDVTGKVLLAHVASHQGVVAADNATGQPATVHYNAVPAVVFTHPEVATVGMKLEQAIAAGHDAAEGQFPFMALGKSVGAGETEGYARVVVDRKTGAILGAQVIGHEASTLIAEMTVAVANELTIEDIEETIHAHPTLSEAWHEATLMAVDRAIHLPPKKRR